MRLADLKRIPVGTKLRLVECLTGPVAEGKQGRVVRKVQSNAMACEVEHRPGGGLSWLYWPKASEFRETADGFAIMEGDEVAARYVFDSGAADGARGEA